MDRLGRHNNLKCTIPIGSRVGEEWDPAFSIDPTMLITTGQLPRNGKK